MDHGSALQATALLRMHAYTVLFAVHQHWWLCMSHLKRCAQMMHPYGVHVSSMLVAS
jgi:hypothetical protein